MSSSPLPEGAPERVLIRRWAKYEEWKPSSQKLLLYLASKGYPIATDKKTKRPTTGEDEIEKLLRFKAKGDPVLEGSLEARRLRHGVSELSEKYVGKDGRFHQEITLAPKTNRMSGRAPNLMNRPQGRKGGIEAEVAEAVRSTIVASKKGDVIPHPMRPGETFVVPEDMTLGELDWKAMEAILLGWFADDQTYIRLARLGLYSYFIPFMPEVGGEVPDLGQDDVSLRAQLDAIKERHPLPYAKMKKTVLARGYGETAWGIARDLGCSQREAQEYISVYERVAPKIKAWQEATRRRAHAEGKLTNPFGYQLKFWDVLKPKEDGTAELGSEANEALAFLPQSTLASMMKEVLLTLGPRIEPGVFHILTPIHDALLIEAVDIHGWMEEVRKVMEQKWEALGGLSIKTEGKVGPSWASMRGWKGAA